LADRWALQLRSSVTAQALAASSMLLRHFDRT
jgi:hypothetical protein